MSGRFEPRFGDGGMLQREMVHLDRGEKARVLWKGP